MLYTTIEIHIPEAMKPYVTEKNAEDELQKMNCREMHCYCIHMYYRRRYPMEEQRKSWEFQN